MATARVVTLIEVQSSWGRGTADDPVRVVTEYFTPEGDLVAIRDPLANGQPKATRPVE